MNPTTVFITRYVNSHEATVGWYTDLFGRAPDEQPMPSCREWRLCENVLFQLIEDPARSGETSTAFGVDDLDAQRNRLRQAGLTVSDPAPVEGFDTLRFAEAVDPEKVPVGLLDGK